MGLMDNINAGLQSGMQSPLFNLGSGLIAGAQPFQNPGAQLMGAAGVTQAEQARQQQLYMQNLQLQMLKQQWPYMKNLFSQLGGLMGGQQNTSAPKGKAHQQPVQNAPPAAPIVGGFSPVPTNAASAPATPSDGVPSGGLMADPGGLERFGLMASMFPMTQPMGKAAQAAASFEAQYNPQIQAQLAAAKSALAQDQLLMQQARSSGDVLAYKGALNKYLTDSKLLNIAAYNGAVTTSQGITPAQLGISTLNPVQGVGTANGQEFAIPGAPLAQQQLAGAKAQGEAQGKTVKVWNPDTKQWGYVPESSFLGGNAPTTTGAGGPAPTTRLAAAPNPEQSHFMEKRGEEAAVNLTSLNDAAKGAKTANYNIDQMLKAAQDVQLGPAADAREWGEKWLGGLGQQFGVAPPAELKNYQILDKYGNQLAFAASRQMGSREAAQIVSLQIQSNPNKSLVQGSFTDIAYSMKAMNNYVIDKNAALQGTGAGSFKSEAQWLQQIDPRVWDLTLSPQMGEKWAKTIGKDAIEKAYEYMTPAEQAQLVQNIPMGLRKKWLASSTR